MKWLTLWLALAVPLHAQEDDPPARPSIPVVGRPTENYYGAAGMDVKVKAEASPLELASDQWLTYTLTITNLLNAADVEKPSLKALPEFAPFQIDESTSLDPVPVAGERDRRVFVYKLRPSSIAIEMIPEIVFRYYHPQRIETNPQNTFPKAYSNPVPIHVRPPVAPPPTLPTPLVVPGFAEQIARGDQVLSLHQTRRFEWLWWPAVLLPPILAVGWLILWKRLYPDAAKRRQLIRNRAVRTALSALASARKARDSVADRIPNIVTRYLHERFDLPLSARAPREIAGHLRTINVAANKIDLASVFFQACDAARFGPHHDGSAGLIDDAERLIVALEEPA